MPLGWTEYWEDVIKVKKKKKQDEEQQRFPTFFCNMMNSRTDSFELNLKPNHYHIKKKNTHTFLETLYFFRFHFQYYLTLVTNTETPCSLRQKVVNTSSHRNDWTDRLTACLKKTHTVSQNDIKNSHIKEKFLVKVRNKTTSKKNICLQQNALNHYITSITYVSLRK